MMAVLPIETYEPGGISSGFGLRRHPITGKMAYHHGIDFPAPVGTPVLAYRAGQVVVSKMQTGGGGLGEYITIAHGDGTYSLYAHLSRRIKKQFAMVKEGDVIGEVGSTGDSTGPHLHFGICRDYKAANVNKSAWKNPAPILAEIIKEGESPVRNLRQGMKGADVRYMQYLLGFSGQDCDGSFGPKTKVRLQAWQHDHGLAADGICGPKTRAALGLADFHVHVFSPGEQVYFCGTPYDDEPKAAHTLKRWAEIEGAELVWNLALFNFSDHRTVVNLRGKGKDIGYGGITEKVAIDWANQVGGEKVAIKDGKRKGGSVVGKRGRCAVGLLEDGRFFIVQSTTTATEYAMTSFMLAGFRVKIMIYQDGGGSTGFYDARRGVLIAPEQEGTDGRRVASVVCWKGASQ